MNAQTNASNASSPETENDLFSPGKAIALSVIFFFLYCVCDTLGKVLQADYSAPQIMTLVNGTGVVLIHFFAFYRYGKNWRIMYHTKNFRLHLVRMVSASCTAFMVLYALKNISLGHFYGLIFTAPFFASFLAHIILDEKISLRRWLLILFGFFGVLLIIFPSLNSLDLQLNALLGYGAVLVAAFAFSCGSLASKLIGKEKTPIPLALYPQLSIFLLNLPFCIQGYTPVQDPIHWGVFFSYGAMLCLAIGLNGYAFSKTPSVSLIIPFQYTQMFWAVLIGWIFFDEVMGVNAIIGATCIIASGLALFFLNAKKEEEAPLPSAEPPAKP